MFGWGICVCVSVCVCLYEWVCIRLCVCVFVYVSVFVMMSHVDKVRICSAEEWVCVCVCVFVYVSVFVMMSNVDKAWICSAEEFLELHGKVEAVVRNCLLRWSGHLVEVPSTHLFDQCFCFKHITLFCATIGAFFRWFDYVRQDCIMTIYKLFKTCDSKSVTSFGLILHMEDKL